MVSSDTSGEFLGRRYSGLERLHGFPGLVLAEGRRHFVTAVIKNLSAETRLNYRRLILLSGIKPLSTA